MAKKTGPALGALVWQARKAARKTQAALAHESKLCISAIRAVEGSRGRVVTLRAILSSLGVELRSRELAGGPLGPALTATRKRRKTSRRELAHSLGVSCKAILSVERGVGLVRVLESYAAAVGASLFIAKIDDPRTFFNHAGTASNFNGWQTPADLGQLLTDAVDGFDLDPCAATIDRRKARVPARLLWKEGETDGLSTHWGAGKKVYVNPPYNRALRRWVAKCHEEFKRGSIVVALIPARTDSRYFHDYIAGQADVFMLKGRLSFGASDAQAPFGSAIILWGGGPKLIERLSEALKGAWHIPARTPGAQGSRSSVAAIPA
jgi:transcriptional regulator with XRE-family HTH domain